jgi:hypothetical protein
MNRRERQLYYLIFSDQIGEGDTLEGNEWDPDVGFRGGCPAVPLGMTTPNLGTPLRLTRHFGAGTVTIVAFMNCRSARLTLGS